MVIGRNTLSRGSDEDMAELYGNRPRRMRFHVAPRH